MTLLVRLSVLLQKWGKFLGLRCWPVLASIAGGHLGRSARGSAASAQSFSQGTDECKRIGHCVGTNITNGGEMSWSYYLNMEELSSEIVEEALSRMSNSNYQSVDNYIKTANGDEFTNNLMWGSTAIVMICCFVESAINTMLRDYSGYSPNGELIKSSIKTKLEVLFSGKTDDFNKIKGDNCWDKYQRVVKVRNQLIHYKNNSPSICSSVPMIDNWHIGGEILGDYFTKDVLEDAYEGSRRLVEMIAKALGLSINPDCEILGCGAGDISPLYFTE